MIVELVETLFGLDEPWRERFLRLITRLATGQWDGQFPEQADVSAWLRASPPLQRQLRVLLSAWVIPERRNVQ